MTEQLPPDWAIERAIELGENSPSPNVKQVVESPHAYRGYIAFARYIAEHEEAPVDPLLIEAKLILQENLSHGSAFHERHAEAMEIALAALRRGIEIGKASA